jgi:DnaJ C terminal domain
MQSAQLHLLLYTYATRTRATHNELVADSRLLLFALHCLCSRNTVVDTNVDDTVMQGLVPEKKVFEVNIEKGHKHNQKIVLRGEAGCSEPNVLPGDVVFVLEQKPHKLFKRIGNDLIMDKVTCGCIVN